MTAANVRSQPRASIVVTGIDTAECLLNIIPLLVIHTEFYGVEGIEWQLTLKPLVLGGVLATATMKERKHDYSEPSADGG